MNAIDPSQLDSARSRQLKSAPRSFAGNLLRPSAFERQHGAIGFNQDGQSVRKHDKMDEGEFEDED